MAANDIEARVADLERRLAALAAENLLLKARPEEGPGGTDSCVAPDARDGGEGGSSAISRRGMFGVVAGAAAAGAVGIIGGAEPAAADSGANVVLGSATNTATSATGIVVTGAPGFGLGCIDSSFGGSFATIKPAMFGHAAGSTSNHGGWLHSDASGGTGVRGEATSATGTGVAGVGSGPSGTGVYAQGGSYGMHAVVNGSSSTAAVAGNAGASGSAGQFITSETLPPGPNTAPALVAEQRSTGVAAALTADRAQLYLRPMSSNRQAPRLDGTSHAPGELLEDGAGNLWLCTVAGKPGTWRKLGGPASSGTLHLLSAPVRMYDSRPLTAPGVGPKTPLAAGESRAVALNLDNTGVAVGAAGALVTCLLVNAVPGSGNFTIWANGVAKPTSNSLVWGGTSGRASSLAVTALDATSYCQISSSIRTDVVIDVVGYYQ